MNEKLTKLIIFIAAVVIHLFLIFYLVFNTDTTVFEPPEVARVMNLIDIAELPPPPVLPPLPPPPPPPSDNQITNQVEAIAEHMIETDTPPDYDIVGAGTLYEHYHSDVYGDGDFLQMNQVSVLPVFDENAIRTSLVYPRIALSSGIGGRVILELFIDRTGTVQRIIILSEEPEGRGFGEAAVRAFTGRRCAPGYDANGEPVSTRLRYPVTFRVR